MILMEELLACALLSAVGIEEKETYFDCLDALFLTFPEDPVLLELEWERDLREAVKILLKTEMRMDDIASFGKLLMNRLETQYRKCDTVADLEKFGEKSYQLWGLLPWELPNGAFSPLNYAQDPLGYGDESQCREIFENMFQNYE